jgi:hypothetical protein
MEIRQLSGEDAEMYRALRLRGLDESPTAFGSSYAEEVGRPVAVVKRRFADEHNHIFGAFTGDGRLVGDGDAAAGAVCEAGAQGEYLCDVRGAGGSAAGGGAGADGGGAGAGRGAGGAAGEP